MPTTEAGAVIRDFYAMEEGGEEAWLERLVFALDQGSPLFLSWAAYHFEVSSGWRGG